MSLRSFADKIQNLNSTILLRSSDFPPSYVSSLSVEIYPTKHILYRPQLHAPPPFTPEGEVVQPVPEKSFIQKYWMYIAALLLILRTSFVQFSPSLTSNLRLRHSSGGRLGRGTTKKSPMSSTIVRSISNQ